MKVPLCPILDNVRKSSRALKALISRAKAGIELDRVPGTYTQITDPRARVVAAIEKVQNSVTPQMAVDMVARYEAGASIREVAAAFKVHRETAARHLRSAGAQLRKAVLTEEQTAQAEVLYLSGQTLAQVGEKFDVSQGTIGRCLRERGAALLADGPRMARSEACR